MQEALTAEEGKEYIIGPAYIRQTKQRETTAKYEAKLYKLKEIARIA